MNIPIPYSEYLQEVKSRVCTICDDAEEDGHCAISGTDTCMIERHLPKIIQVAYMVESNKLPDYIATFREHVCSECKEDGAAHCAQREDGGCGLDAYFPLVVEAIDAVNRRHSVM